MSAAEFHTSARGNLLDGEELEKLSAGRQDKFKVQSAKFKVQSASAKVESDEAVSVLNFEL
jgi:hypothetical protein